MRLKERWVSTLPVLEIVKFSRWEIERFDRRFSLSVSTLRRIFELIPRKSEYTQSTLNSLARFVVSEALNTGKRQAHHMKLFPTVKLRITLKNQTQ